MKTYSDLLDIEPVLDLRLEIETIGSPDYSIKLNNIYVPEKFYTTKISLLEPVTLDIRLQNKIYTTEYETAVIIKSFLIDDILILPKYDYLVNYTNDKNYTLPTSYLGFNGRFLFDTGKPFYHWYHEINGRGWLLE